MTPSRIAGARSSTRRGLPALRYARSSTAASGSWEDGEPKAARRRPLPTHRLPASGVSGPDIPLPVSWGAAASVNGRLLIAGGAYRDERVGDYFNSDRVFLLRGAR